MIKEGSYIATTDVTDTLDLNSARSSWSCKSERRAEGVAGLWNCSWGANEMCISSGVERKAAVSPDGDIIASTRSCFC